MSESMRVGVLPVTSQMSTLFPGLEPRKLHVVVYATFPRAATSAVKRSVSNPAPKTGITAGVLAPSESGAGRTPTSTAGHDGEVFVCPGVSVVLSLQAASEVASTASAA